MHIIIINKLCTESNNTGEWFRSYPSYNDRLICSRNDLGQIDWKWTFNDLECVEQREHPALEHFQRRCMTHEEIFLRVGELTECSIFLGFLDVVFNSTVTLQHSGDNGGFIFDWSSASSGTNRHFQSNILCSLYVHVFLVFYLKYKMYFRGR